MKHYAPTYDCPKRQPGNNVALLSKIPKLEKGDNSAKYLQTFAKR